MRDNLICAFIFFFFAAAVKQNHEAEFSSSRLLFRKMYIAYIGERRAISAPNTYQWKKIDPFFLLRSFFLFLEKADRAGVAFLLQEAE